MHFFSDKNIDIDIWTSIKIKLRLKFSTDFSANKSFHDVCVRHIPGRHCLKKSTGALVASNYFFKQCRSGETWYASEKNYKKCLSTVKL